MSMGKRIKAARVMCRFSQEDVAKKLGVTRSAVSQWESDVTSPHRRVIKDLASVLCVSQARLLLDEGEPLEKQSLSLVSSAGKFAPVIACALIVGKLSAYNEPGNNSNALLKEIYDLCREALEAGGLQFPVKH